MLHLVYNSLLLFLIFLLYVFLIYPPSRDRGDNGDLLKNTYLVDDIVRQFAASVLRQVAKRSHSRSPKENKRRGSGDLSQEIVHDILVYKDDQVEASIIYYQCRR